MTLLTRVAPGPDGKFTYTAVAPGQYTISARATRLGGRGGAPAGAPARAGERFSFGSSGRRRAAVLADQSRSCSGVEVAAAAGRRIWATADVNVDGANLSNITSSLQPGMTLSGRVQFDAKKLAGADGPQSRVASRWCRCRSASGAIVTLGGFPTAPDGCDGQVHVHRRHARPLPVQRRDADGIGAGWRT